MPHLLRIKSSSRHGGSHSRALADAAEAAWRASNFAGTVTTRDATDGTIPVIALDTITGFVGPSES
jgi:FMN-dependent NADH-azoreductase